MTDIILDPTGGRATKGATGQDAASHLAARPTSLEGLRIGLLDNTKHNALSMLTQIGEILVKEHGAAEVSIVETKQTFSVPVDETIVNRYRENCDVVITGVGDCGSCSAAGVADGINFEKAGLPAAVVLTDAFDVTGKTMAGVQGVPEYVWIRTAHPIAVLENNEVTARAKSLVPEVLATLTSEGTAA